MLPYTEGATMQDRSIETGTDELLCSVEHRVAMITLNRPAARNALSDTLTPALRRTIRDLDDDPEVGAIVLTGAGQAFCSGGNIKDMGALAPTTVTGYQQRVKLLRERQNTLTGKLRRMRTPTIAVLPGPAAGAGLALALACDLRAASIDAFVVTNYVNLALPGDYGISWLLIRLTGLARAHELMLLSERIDAQRCLQMGLVNWLFPEGELLPKSLAIARRIADGPADAVAAIKSNLEHAAFSTFQSSLDLEAEHMVAAGGTDENREAVRAFIGKRRPLFHPAK
jgi:enoyl-CoA hydratase/carnithine racemase